MQRSSHYLFLILLSYASTSQAMNIKTISFSENGGIQSICTAQKKGSEICIIGHARCEKFEIGPYTTADNIAKNWLILHFGRWYAGDIPVAVLTFDSQDMAEKYTAYYKNKNSEDLFHAPLHSIIHIAATKEKFQDGNLQIITTPCFGDMDQAPWDPTIYFREERFPNFAQKAALTFQEVQ